MTSRIDYLTNRIFNTFKIYTLSQKTSHLRLAIILTYTIRLRYF